MPRLPNGGPNRTVWENDERAQERVKDDNLPIPLPPRNVKHEVIDADEVSSPNSRPRELLDGICFSVDRIALTYEYLCSVYTYIHSRAICFAAMQPPDVTHNTYSILPRRIAPADRVNRFSQSRSTSDDGKSMIGLIA